MRILHVTGEWAYGGVEMWLMHVFRRLDGSHRMEILLNSNPPSPLESELARLGVKIHYIGHNPRSRTLLAKVFRHLKKHGPYDVVHSHFNHASGAVMAAAWAAGVPERISHAHNDISSWLAKQPPKMKRRCTRLSAMSNRFSTSLLGASLPSGDSIFGHGWNSRPRCRTLYCGVDMTAFEHPADREAIRRELGIAPHRHVIGHIGRFAEQKNHAFLVRIAEEYRRIDPDVCFVLIGEGPLEPQIRAQVAAAGLEDHVRFLGRRTDIPRIMTGLMDAFVMCSNFEALTLVLMEAQAAGLPSVYSTRISNEVATIPELMRQLSLDEPPRRWAEALHQARREYQPRWRTEALRVMKESPFNIDHSARELLAFYDSAPRRKPGHRAPQMAGAAH
ncbi:MAG: glycosyltransferase [Bryobacteraceae bacterium]